MKLPTKTMALATASLLAVSAQATSFTFTDTLSSGQTITGSFDGTLAGNLVTGLSNISVFANGAAFKGNGSLYDSSYNNNSGWSKGTGVVSLDGTQNNFVFLDDPTFPNTGNYTNYFYSVGGSGNQSPDSFYNLNNGTNGSNNSAATNFRASAVSAVPEPASWAMMLVGFGAIGYSMRRRTRTSFSVS